MNINEILKSELSKRDFLIGLVYLSKLDGVIDSLEKAFFIDAANSLQLSKEMTDQINACWANDVLPELNFQNKTEKLFFLIQAIQLCNVDSIYSEKEKEYIYQTALNLGISIESVQEIEEWVSEGVKWQSKGNALLELEG